MIDEIVGALRGTPVWVWPLLGFLIYLGIRALKPATVSLWQLAILPAVFLIWGLHSVATNASLDVATGSLWLVGLLAGFGCGVWLTTRSKASADRPAGTLAIPGSAIPLIVTVVIFALEYTLGYMAGRWPEMTGDPVYNLFGFGLSGALAGLLIGRFAGFVRIYLAG